MEGFASHSWAESCSFHSPDRHGGRPLPFLTQTLGGNGKHWSVEAERQSSVERLCQSPSPGRVLPNVTTLKAAVLLCAFLFSRKRLVWLKWWSKAGRKTRLRGRSQISGVSPGSVPNNRHMHQLNVVGPGKRAQARRLIGVFAGSHDLSHDGGFQSIHGKRKRCSSRSRFRRQADKNVPPPSCPPLSVAPDFQPGGCASVSAGLAAPCCHPRGGEAFPGDPW
jgi:hypothetical protein